jgi:hypothetical protein
MKTQSASRNRNKLGTMIASISAILAMIWVSSVAAPRAVAAPVCGEWAFVSEPSPNSSSLYDADAVSSNDVFSTPGECANWALSLGVDPACSISSSQARRAKGHSPLASTLGFSPAR